MIRSSLLIIALLFNKAYADDLEKISQTGRVLSLAAQDKKEVKLKTLENQKEVKKFIKENKCPDYDYKAFVIDNEDETKVYLLGFYKKDVLIGRHFVGQLIDQSLDLSSIKSSSEKCLNLGEPFQPNSPLFVSHDEDIPNEFHVFASEFSQIPIFVSAKKGLYRILRGKLSAVQK